MTVQEPPERAAPHAWATIAQAVVDDLYSLQGYDNVMLCHFDRAAGVSTPVAWAGRHSEVMRRVAGQITRLFPGANPWEVKSRWDVNPHMARLWSSGDTVIDSVAHLNRGVNAEAVLNLICRVSGIRYAICVPLRVDGVSIGSILGFQRSPEFPVAKVRYAEAFARQVSLSIHNVQLLNLQRQTSAALASSMQLLGQAEDRTRRSISEFLHSQVQSKLLVAWSRLDDVRAQDTASQRVLDDVRRDLELLREHDVRLVSHQLHPEALGVGLIPALQVLISRFHRVLEISLVANDVLAALDNHGGERLPQSLRLIVFRTVEEALGNVLKHAGAAHVTVSVTVQDGDLRVSVADDGRGFDPQAVTPGLGLRCLAARVEASCNHWTVDSRPGGPTTVRAWWPL
ncbi:GAF domain-containing sensor histidine kinase [Deinococcus rufus]|uniref:histidine kinase n=1 Tax=Deinococcus rufus TaxID=2136097 RepID=A0ABV7ZBG3_9DEIO